MTEVIHTDASFAVFFLMAVVSTSAESVHRKLAEVNSTARSSQQQLCGHIEDIG